MPVLTILDETGASLLSTDLKKPGIGRYIQGALNLRSGGGARDILKRPLADGFKDRELALTAEHAVPIGTKNELSLTPGRASPSASGVRVGSCSTTPTFRSPVEVPPGTAYIVLTLDAHLKAGLSAQGTIGFAFSAGTAVRYTYCHPVRCRRGVADRRRKASRRRLKHAVFPADVADLAALLPGAFVSIAGEGTHRLQGRSDAARRRRTCWRLRGCRIVGVAQCRRTASVTASAAWSASGEFELRACEAVRVAECGWRSSSAAADRCRFGANASMGVSADIRGSDPIAALMRAISSEPRSRSAGARRRRA